MRYLAIDNEGHKSKWKLTAKPVSVGRSSKNDIALPDEQMASRKHCVIEMVGDSYLLRDAGSTNGTRVNGRRLDEAVLVSGDKVSIGSVKLTYIDTDAPPPSKTQKPPAEAENMKLGDVDDAALAMPVEDNHGFDDLRPSSKVIATDPTESLAHLFKYGRATGIAESDISLLDARGHTIHKATEIADDDDETAGARTLRLFRMLLASGFETHASDIHFEPQASGGAVRIRVDGTMVDALDVDSELLSRVLNMVKILGNIDISQKNIVQESHFSVDLPNRTVDYRISFTPSVHGQKLVIRILDPTSAPQHMDNLLLPDWMLRDIRTLAKQTSGMLLVCGPTGSGKTTTLYAVLRDIDRQQRNVITIEDPVEYQIDNVTHMPANQQGDNTFNSLLRSVLRQDPDVILLGEIRDKETAQTAMQAAMTGHLVLSTVHAKDTIGTIFRLLDLEVEPYLLGSSLNLVLAQRLIRILCDNCKAPCRPVPSQLGLMGRHAQGVKSIYVPVGCPKCLTVGYANRRALFELMTVNDALRDAILKSPTMTTIREALRRTVFINLSEMGWQMVARGLTSAEEVERIVGHG
jgi:general secretion pathway protein E